MKVIGLAIIDVLDKGQYPLNSLPFHIKRLLKEFIVDGVETGVKCPECGGNLVFVEGCQTCYHGCGYSKCG